MPRALWDKGIGLTDESGVQCDFPAAKNTSLDDDDDNDDRNKNVNGYTQYTVYVTNSLYSLSFLIN